MSVGSGGNSAARSISRESYIKPRQNLGLDIGFSILAGLIFVVLFVAFKKHILKAIENFKF